MFVEGFDYNDSFGETADLVIADLHAAQSAKNAGDIALMKALVACDRRRVSTCTTSFRGLGA